MILCLGEQKAKMKLDKFGDKMENVFGKQLAFVAEHVFMKKFLKNNMLCVRDNVFLEKFLKQKNHFGVYDNVFVEKFLDKYHSVVFEHVFLKVFGNKTILLA